MVNLLLLGHTYEDYRDMFALSEDDLHKSIVDFASDFSSFASEMNRRKHNVVGIDKTYDMTGRGMEEHVWCLFEEMFQSIKQQSDRLEWERHVSPEFLIQKRHEAAEMFLLDYGVGRKQGRYIPATLPDLSDVANTKFELALCSHFFFADDELGYDFHLQSIQEICQMTQELRIFPLLNGQSENSPLLKPLMLDLHESGLDAEVVEVPYEFQKGGNSMLRVK